MEKEERERERDCERLPKVGISLLLKLAEIIFVGEKKNDDNDNDDGVSTQDNKDATDILISCSFKPKCYSWWCQSFEVLVHL